MATHYKAIRESERYADQSLRALREAIERRAERSRERRSEDGKGSDAR